MNAKYLISSLPFSLHKKLTLYNKLRSFFWKIKYSSEKAEKLTQEQTFIPSNSYYGHEYWLKNYCDFNDNIYGLIEHGVYFGDNRNKVGFDIEWEVGNIITYGESRRKLLQELYPEYNILEIGPRIHYAPLDENYYNEISSRLLPNEKTVAVFPAHSLAKQKTNYNVAAFLESLYSFVQDNKIKNIVICLHPSDLLHKIDLQYKNRNFIIASGGNDSISFLPRLKAIISVADTTFSNSLGTHIGYCIYLGKPHVMISQHYSQEKLCNKYASVFEKEKKLFTEIFNNNNPFSISAEQYELCDYYWGISQIKSKETLHKELLKCNKLYLSHFKLIK